MWKEAFYGVWWFKYCMCMRVMRGHNMGLWQGVLLLAVSLASVAQQYCIIWKAHLQILTMPQSSMIKNLSFQSYILYSTRDVCPAVSYLLILATPCQGSFLGVQRQIAAMLYAQKHPLLKDILSKQAITTNPSPCWSPEALLKSFH